MDLGKTHNKMTDTIQIIAEILKEEGFTTVLVTHTITYLKIHIPNGQSQYLKIHNDQLIHSYTPFNLRVPNPQPQLYDKTFNINDPQVFENLTSYIKGIIKPK